MLELETKVAWRCVIIVHTTEILFSFKSSAVCISVRSISSSYVCVATAPSATPERWSSVTWSDGADERRLILVFLGLATKSSAVSLYPPWLFAIQMWAWFLIVSIEGCVGGWDVGYSWLRVPEMAGTQYIGGTHDEWIIAASHSLAASL